MSNLSATDRTRPHVHGFGVHVPGTWYTAASVKCTYAHRIHTELFRETWPTTVLCRQAHAARFKDVIIEQKNQKGRTICTFFRTTSTEHCTIAAAQQIKNGDAFTESKWFVPETSTDVDISQVGGRRVTPALIGESHLDWHVCVHRIVVHGMAW